MAGGPVVSHARRVPEAHHPPFPPPPTQLKSAVLVAPEGVELCPYFFHLTYFFFVFFFLSSLPFSRRNEVTFHLAQSANTHSSVERQEGGRSSSARFIEAGDAG